MSLILRVLESASALPKMEFILDAEDRGHFLPHELKGVSNTVGVLVEQGDPLDIVSILILMLDFMQDNNFLATAHCCAILNELEKQYY